MNKKIIISAAVLFVLTLTIVILNLMRSGTDGTQTGGGVEQPIGNLPIDDSGKPIADGQPGKSFRDSAIRVEDRNNVSQIKNSFENYVGQNVNDFPNYIADGISQDYPLADKDGKLVDLELFFKSVDATVNPKLRGLIGSNYYGLFYCVNGNKQKEYGLALDAGSSDPSKAKTEHDEAKSAMRLWEPYMLKDLRTILFPGINLEKKYLGQPVVFKDGQYRYAEIDFPSGKKAIHYTVKDAPTNRIYITTSQECLKKALEYLFDI